MPQVGPIMQRLESLEVEELQEFMENEQYLDDFLEEQPEIINMKLDADKVRETAYKFAKNNCELFEQIS